MPNGPYRWNRNSARYVDASGRFVSPKTVRAWLTDAVESKRRRMQQAARIFRDTRADLAGFEAVMREGIKTTHLLSAMAAVGGHAQMTAQDYGRVGAIVRFHYGKLERWMRDLAAGNDVVAPLDGRFAVRAALYAGASLGTYHLFAGEAARAAGYATEENVLGSADEANCEECVAQTAAGSVPIGTLIPVGQRQCLGNCRCDIRFGP